MPNKAPSAPLTGETNGENRLEPHGLRMGLVAGIVSIIAASAAGVYTGSLLKESEVAALYTADAVKLAARYTANCMTQEIDMDRYTRMTPEERRKDKGIGSEEIDEIARKCQNQTLQRIGLKGIPKTPAR